jgi:hypothetical protein
MISSPSIDTNDLKCHSFGAVVEEFELHDAMAQILAEKDDIGNAEMEYDMPLLAFGMAQQQISAC